MNRRKILFYTFTTLLLVIIILSVLLLIKRNSSPEEVYVDPNTTSERLETILNSNPKTLYGINVDNYTVKSHRVKNGETLSSILNNNYDLNIVIINELMPKCKGVFDLRDLRAGNKYTAFTKDNEIHYLVYEKDQMDYVIFSTYDSIYVENGKKKITVKEKYVEGIIDQSLYYTLESQGGNILLANMLAEIFEYTINFFDIQEGDSFRILYEEHYIDSVSIGLRRLYCAEITHKGTPYIAIRFEQNNRLEFWDSKGNSMKKSFLRAPLSFYKRVSSGYGMRTHPIKKIRQHHNGIDYAAPIGTLVYAVADGTVQRSYWDRNGGGNVIWLKHAKGIESAYLHLHRFAKGMVAGRRVQKGQVIAYVGNTGGSTGPHLDFRIKKNGRYINPDSMPSEPGDPIKSSNRKAFNQMGKEVVEVMDEYRALQKQI